MFVRVAYTAERVICDVSGPIGCHLSSQARIPRSLTSKLSHSLSRILLSLRRKPSWRSSRLLFSTYTRALPSLTASLSLALLLLLSLLSRCTHTNQPRADHAIRSISLPLLSPSAPRVPALTPSLLNPRGSSLSPCRFFRPPTFSPYLLPLPSCSLITVPASILAHPFSLTLFSRWNQWRSQLRDFSLCCERIIVSIRRKIHLGKRADISRCVVHS